MKITFKGMKFEAIKQPNGAYRIETESGRYFIHVNEAASGKGWIGSIWKHTNCFGGCEIVRNVTTKRGGWRLTRRTSARAMLRAALENYNNV